MKVIEELEELDKHHGLNNLIRKRIITWNIVWYKEIYTEFDAFIKLGYGIEDAAFMVSEKLKISSRTVHRVKKIMESES